MCNDTEPQSPRATEELTIVKVPVDTGPLLPIVW